MPIAAVAGSNGQSALPLVGQVGASRDLSEATRRGAVRALWGTVTHTAADPFSFSDSVHFIDCRPFHRAEFFARLWSISFPINLLSLGIDLASWNIDDCAVRVLTIYSVKLFWRFPIIQGALHFRNRRFKCPKCLQRSGSFPREPSKKIWLGSWTPLVFIEDVFLRNRATTYFRFQCCWRLLSSTWQQEDWTPPVYTEVPNYVTAFLKRLLSYFRISEGVSLIYDFKLCTMAGLDPTGQYWGSRGRSEKKRGNSEDSRDISRSRHDCYQGSRSDRTVLKYQSFRNSGANILMDPVISMMEEVRGKEEISSSNLRRLIWSIHIRKGRHRTFLMERQWKCRICLHTGWVSSLINN